jgi:hypothetical protein
MRFFVQAEPSIGMREACETFNAPRSWPDSFATAASYVQSQERQHSFSVQQKLFYPSLVNHCCLSKGYRWIKDFSKHSLTAHPSLYSQFHTLLITHDGQRFTLKRPSERAGFSRIT